MNIRSVLFEGIDEDTKRCGICKNHLPLGCFGKDGGAKYLRYECKSCAKTQSAIVKKIKKSEQPPAKNHICPICKKDAEAILLKNPNKKGSKKGIWCADHNHKTGKFRDWLCHKCNLGIGNLDDDPDILDAGSNYLRKHE